MVGYKQCDLSKNEILLTIEIISTNCKHFKQCVLFSNWNKDIINMGTVPRLYYNQAMSVTTHGALLQLL